MTPRDRISLLFFLGTLGALMFSSPRFSHRAEADTPATETPLYSNDFEKAAEGEPPKEIVILNGAFEIKAVEGNKVLELPGDPVDSYGVLFGPEGQAYLKVQARIYATSTAKRMPEFGVGLGDSNGYKLWLMPATGQLQILKGEEVVAKAEYPSWKTGAWTVLKLQARSDGGKTVVEGKAWPHGQSEPAGWSIRHEDGAEPPKGRASAWGVPFSSTPIRFDDLVVSAAPK